MYPRPGPGPPPVPQGPRIRIGSLDAKTDCLSVAASIAGLITVAEAVSRKSHLYNKWDKYANEDVSKIVAETTELYAILHGLQMVASRFEAEDHDRTIQPHHVHSCYVMLDKLDSKLPNYGNGFRFWNATWPFSSLETKEMVEELGHQKSTLKLALSADSMSALLFALSRQERPDEDSSDVRNDVVQSRRAEEKRKREKSLHKLSSVDAGRIHQTSVCLRQPGTGVWFLENPSFKKWLSEDHGKLWLYGIAGAGKTILTSTIIQELQKPEQKEKGMFLDLNPTRLTSD